MFSPSLQQCNYDIEILRNRIRWCIVLLALSFTVACRCLILVDRELGGPEEEVFDRSSFDAFISNANIYIIRSLKPRCPNQFKMIVICLIESVVRCV